MGLLKWNWRDKGQRWTDKLKSKKGTISPPWNMCHAYVFFILTVRPQEIKKVPKLDVSDGWLNRNEKQTRFFDSVTDSEVPECNEAESKYKKDEECLQKETKVADLQDVETVDNLLT